jgi:preprotein translocase subunit SecE
VGNRALRRQQAKTKERAGDKARSGSSRAIPSGPRPQPGPSSARRGGLLGGPGRFFGDIWSELKKVVWPEREDVVHLTVVVVIVTIMIGAVLGAIDLGFGWLVDETLLN